MNPTLLKICHWIGLTNLTDEEVKKYCALRLAEERGELEPREKVIGGKIYKTEGSTLITHYVSDTYCWRLFRTKNGNYFSITAMTALPLSTVKWYKGSIEPMSPTRAMDMYMSHKEFSKEPFETAFPGVKLEDA